MVYEPEGPVKAHGYGNNDSRGDLRPHGINIQGAQNTQRVFDTRAMMNHPYANDNLLPENLPHHKRLIFEPKRRDQLYSQNSVKNIRGK